jgi:hypothetical protein
VAQVVESQPHQPAGCRWHLFTPQYHEEKKTGKSQEWWCTPIISALRRMRQEDHDFYMGLQRETPVSKKEHDGLRV